MCEQCWPSQEAYMRWSFDAVDPHGMEPYEDDEESTPEEVAQEAVASEPVEYCTCDDPTSPFCDGPHAPEETA